MVLVCNSNDDVIYNNVIKILKNKGYRITDIRIMIIKTIIKEGHITLSSLVKKLKEDFISFNLMSVYNTINLLVKEHILFTNTFDGKHIWYDLVENISYHVVCDYCKEVLHLMGEEQSNVINFGDLVESFRGIKWVPIHFKIEGHGMCKKCQDYYRKVKL